MILNLEYKLNELKHLQIPKMSFDDIKGFENISFSSDEIVTINQYLSNYANLKNDNCLCCGSKSFKWSIVYGIVECLDCGWESRVSHVIKNKNTAIIMQMNMHLQYHPDVYEIIEK